MVLSREFQIKKRTNISIEENHRCQFLVIHNSHDSLSAFGESLTCVELWAGLLTNYWLLARSMEQKCNEKLLLLATEALIANGLMERGCSSTFIISSLNSICCQVLGSVCVSLWVSECVHNCCAIQCDALLCIKWYLVLFGWEKRREREKKSVKASQTLLKTRNAFPFIIIMLRTLYKLQLFYYFNNFFPFFGELESTTHTHTTTTTLSLY